MSLTTENKKRYRTIGHGLNPVVTVAGKGLTEGVINELERALDDHELIKVKLMILDKKDRIAISDEICKLCRCELVQSIGKVILLLREAKKPHIQKSNIR